MLFWSDAQYVGLVVIPVSWLAMTYHYVREIWHLPRRHLAGFLVIPALTLVFVFTNDLHGLMFASVSQDPNGQVPVILEEYGPWFWVHAAYSYCLLFLSITLLIGAMFRAPSFYRGQPLALLIGMLVPLAWNISFVLNLGPARELDMTPVISSLGAAIIAWGLFHYGLFASAPVAYDTVINAIDDGVLVADLGGRIVDVNPAAQKILACSASQVIGQKFTHAFRHLPELTRLCSNPSPPYTVLIQGTGSTQTSCAARVAPLMNRQGQSLGRLFVFRDFTRRKNVEDALRESDQRYHELADSLPETVFEADTAGRIVVMNKAGLEQFGYTLEEAQQSLCFLDMVDLTDRDRASRDIQQAMQNREALGAQEYLALKKDGCSFPCAVSSTVVVRDGETVGFRSLIMDVTSHKQVQQEREHLLYEVERWAAHLDAIIGAIPVGLVILDAEGNIVQMNANAKRILAHPAIEHAPLRDRIRLLDMKTTEGKPVPVHAAPPLRALRGETVRNEVVVLHLADGGTVCTSISAGPIAAPSGRIVGAVATFADITALLELQNGREDIIRAVSHDLRGPLTVILGHGQILDQQFQKRGRERWRESSESIVLAARQMNGMIRDLVDSIRMETGQLELNTTELDVPEFVRDMMKRLASVLETERVQVETPEALPPALVDADRLERIVMNLITNALKYSDPGSQVIVSFYHKGGEVVTSVSDRGEGIPIEEMPQLFTKFGRTRRSSAHRESLGLGLYITKGLVEAHRGRIWAESEVGKGTQFRFTLPASTEAVE